MKTDWKHWLQLTLRSRDFGWYLLLVGVIPLVLLAITGFYFLAREGSLLLVLLAWTTLALAVAAWLRYRQRKSPTDSDNPINPAIPSLQPAPDWTEQDHAAWKLAQAFIEQHVEADTPWITLRELAIEQHTLLARHYVPTEKNHQLSFTLPELLLVLEITSARYRAFIRENIPFADSIQLATVKTLYDKKDSARKGYRFINTARRVLRLTNPLVAATGEIRDHISGKLLGQASHTLTLELKRVLLQELAQVAIDLYSGRLKVADAELAEYVSSATRNDLARQAEPIESLRIAVAGQTNAGKSTLINALRHETATDSPEQPQAAHITPAETDVLPTTDATRVYPWQLSSVSSISLVDTVGLDGSDSSRTLLLKQVESADVLLWVCKANQPARALDNTALSSIRQWFAEHPERIPPPIVVVVTHSDRIPPTDTWNPDEWELPFPLTAADNTDQTDPAIVKQCNIGAAVDTVRNALALGPDTAVVPVALPPALPVFNVQGVIDALKLHTERATNAQLNRRRVEHVNRSPSWSSRLRQLNSLLKRTRSRFWPQA